MGTPQRHGCDQRNGVQGQFAQHQALAANVRFGSTADIEAPSPDVRFTRKSGHCRATVGCPLCAISRHRTSAREGIGAGAVKQVLPKP
jgi:hypothetical protein